LWFVAAVGWFLFAALPATPPAVAFSMWRTSLALGRGAGFLLLAYLGLYFYASRGVLPRLVVLYFLWEAILLTVAWRIIFVAVFSRKRFRSRAIIVGSGAAAAAVLRILREHRARQADVEAFVAETDTPDGTLDGIPALRAEDLQQALERRGVSELILALRNAPDAALFRTLLSCQEAGVSLVRMQTLYEQVLRRVPVDHLAPDWLMTDLADAMRLGGASWWGKRWLDIAGGTAGTILLVIVAPAIAAAIWLDSGGPVFYRQRRVGRGGRAFELIKFRTMARDAEMPGEPQWAGRNDPRVTRVGRFLRRARLDELPQVLNVLGGEMSLVGPRPERAEFVARLQNELPFYRARLMVPPGLTGWAQVNLPYGDSVDAARAKLEYDLYYVKHRALAFDMAIMLRTVGTVLRLRGV
jgi:exopolysaccharide biosynthesis polyprenyl glycosylphosphotransferase